MTAPWHEAAWSPFGVALEPVIEPEADPFGVAAPPVDDEVHAPVVDDTGAPVLDWEVVKREDMRDGEVVRVTQLGTWKGTRVTGKTVTYERKATPAS